MVRAFNAMHPRDTDTWYTREQTIWCYISEIESLYYFDIVENIKGILEFM